MPHVASEVIGSPWLIHPDKARVILAAIGPRLGLARMEDMPPAVEAEEPELPEAPVGIAVLRIDGTLLHRSLGMTAMSGLNTYEEIRAELDAALEDPAVDGILLDINSPGGLASGNFDLADAIYAARGRKPIYAVANESAFSAAYSLASAAERVFVPRTAGVGSVGVVFAHVDESQADHQAGLKYTLIHAGARKVDGNSHEPLSARARGDMQQRVDSLYELFVSTVSRNLGMDEAKVRETEAGVFFGADAVEAGLAHEVGTRDDALAALAAEARKKKKPAMRPFPVGVVGHRRTA